jgi:ABC-type transporter Mla maintaining outer membrane lipid asymmetry ATPase subunit MlaF
MLNEQQLGEIIISYLLKELKPEQMISLDQWRAVSNQNEQLFQQLTHPDNLKRPVNETDDLQTSIWKKIVRHCPELSIYFALLCSNLTLYCFYNR